MKHEKAVLKKYGRGMDVDYLKKRGYSEAMGIPIAREGAKIISFFFMLFAVSFIFDHPIVTAVLGVVFLFVCSFFRDPRRAIDRDAEGIYSPADGKITSVEEVVFNGQAYSKIVIFLSVFNCHVNRVPYKGKVVSTTHIPGKFLAAFRKDIDQKNERQETLIETDKGVMKVVQITGAIARRIVCHLKEKQPVETGERFGLIKFGSRTDVYFPQSAKVLVKKGQNIKGGLTKLAQF